MTLRPQLASRFKKGGKKVAFTLAEVLVTLGIIGIVAAMTLPMLAKNYQFYVRQQQFKKAYATLSIAIQKTQIDMGEGVRCYSKNLTSGQRQTSECDYFYSELVKNLKLVAKCTGNALENHCIPRDFPDPAETYVKVQGSDNPEAAKESFNSSCAAWKYSFITTKPDVYVFNDFYIIPSYTGSAMKRKSLHLLVDVNGHQGPNKFGHDIFLFLLYKPKESASVFSLIYATACHPIDFGGYYTKHFFEYLYGQNAEL